MSTSRTFRIFVSSTFSDLKAERNALQERVFPRLRALAAKHNHRFQAIDLRWGVSDQASLDQQAMNICLGEIARCQQASPRPNFIVLLGDRYGWCPPPSQVPKVEFDRIHEIIKDADELALLDDWYQLDRNAVPLQYRLKARKRGGPYDDYEAWEPVEARLQSILARAVEELGFTPEQCLPYRASATEQEIAAGALGVAGAEQHVHCFFRQIDGLPQRFDLREFLAEVERRIQGAYPAGLPDAPGAAHLQALKGLDPAASARDCYLRLKAWRAAAPKATPESDFLAQLHGWLVDYTGRDFQNLGTEDWLPDPGALAAQNDLKERLAERVPGNEHYYQARWTGRGITSDHLDTLCEDVYNALASIIEAEIESPHLPQTAPRPAQVHPGAALDEEGLAHQAFAEERLRFFVGRTKILEDIAAYIQNSQRPDRYLTGEAQGNHPAPIHREEGLRAPLVIVGAGGSGKSALMAKAIQQAQKAYPQAQLVYRFIGATPASSDGRGLLYSLCRELARRYGADESAIPIDYRELVPALEQGMQSASQERPLVLFLDSLDQLAESQDARSLAWLPAKLPEYVSVVVSTRPEDTLDRLVARGVPQEQLGGLSDEEGSQLLSAWLAHAGRTLQEPQKQAVLHQFKRSQSAPLYLKLAFEEARLWVSGEDGRPPETLQPGIPGIIQHNLLDRLANEGAHGRMLVSKVLGYLGAARYGLAEDEMVDLLSRDLEVYRWFLESSYHLPADLVRWAALYRCGQVGKDPLEVPEPDGDQLRAAAEWLQEIRVPPDELLVFLRQVLPQPQGPRLPVVLWSRLSTDLEPYLSQRTSEGSTLLTFYHRELGDVSKAVFLSDGKDLSFHENLADYFYARSDPQADGSWSGEYPRGLSELPYHLTAAKRWEQVFETLTDFRFLEEKAAKVAVVESQDERGALVKSYTGVFQLQEDYQRARAAMPGGDGGDDGGAPLILTAKQYGNELKVYCPACNQTSKIERGQLDQVITCPQANCNRKLKLNPFVTKMG